MSTVRMEVLVQALVALQVADKALRDTPMVHEWVQVMRARTALQVELGALPAVEVKPAEVTA